MNPTQPEPPRANSPGAEPGSGQEEKGLPGALQELRGALDGMQAMTFMLAQTTLTEDQARYVRTIEAAGRSLHEKANQMLDMASERTGGAAFSPAALIAEVSDFAKAQAAGKALAFRFYMDEEAPATVTGDAGCLREVLLHLLMNAVRHTEAGEIRLDVRREDPAPEIARDDSKDRARLRFTVIDTGAGEKSGVFEKAEMIRCGELVQRLGGELSLHAVPWEGSTFWFTAAFTEGPASPAGGAGGKKAVEPSGLAGGSLRILIAEDHPINQVVLAEQLTGMGHVCMAVVNGAEALKAIRQAPWDVVLLDCNMPVMDGYKTVEHIRRDEAAGAGRRLWVIAVTANAMASEREACLRAGMDDFVSKPLRTRDLAAALARVPAAAAHGEARAVLDRAALDTLGKSKTASGENLLEKMTRLFIESGPELLDAMDAALQRDDLVEAIRAPHKLAGGCSYFGAESLRQMCAEFERLGRLEDRTAIRGLAPRIRNEYARVEIALKEALHTLTGQGRPNPVAPAS